MRVIAGSARRMALRAPEGQGTRPTTDRIKETLFNMIQYDLADCCFLDLFAGSGGIGIEALSRGARQCVFVEQDVAATAVVRANLRATHLEDRAYLLRCDAAEALAQLEGRFRFDFVFMDPPYRQGLEKQMLTILRASTLIDRQSTIIIEAALDEDVTYLGEFGYETEKIKKYKTNKHLFVYRGDNGYDDRSLSGQL